MPRWMIGKGRGWVTAEYGMLPASTGDRKQRDVTQGPPRRAHGRDPAPDRPLAARHRRLRGARRAHDLRRLRRPAGRRRHPLRVDHRRLRRARRSRAASCVADGLLERSPLTGSVAAVSCGVVDGVPLLDLDYPEDSSAEVDANVVMTGDGGLVEVQATAERTPLSRAHLDDLLALAQHGHRGPARDPGRRRRLKPACGSCSRPATPTSSASSGGCCRRSSSTRCPTASQPPPEDGDTYAANALIKARAAARGHRPRRDRRRLRDRGRGARRRARRPHGALRRRARDRRREPRQARRRGARRQRPAVRLRDRPRRARRRRAPVRGRRDGHAWRHEPRGDGRLRLRPAVRARRRPPTAARWPSCPTPRRTRSPTAAARRARSRSGWR